MDGPSSRLGKVGKLSIFQLAKTEEATINFSSAPAYPVPWVRVNRELKVMPESLQGSYTVAWHLKSCTHLLVKPLQAIKAKRR
jgi:hypothetical protein